MEKLKKIRNKKYMSNQDSNGIELPWVLLKVNIPEGQWIYGLKDQVKYKIIPNPLWEHESINSETLAITSCFRDAIVNMNFRAAQAMVLHLQDIWKWKEN
jgi:hypothetical protein